MEVLQSPDLAEELQREFRVMLVGPGTFSAMLSALQAGFRTLTIQQKATEVMRLLSQVETEFGRYTESLEETRVKLGQAQDALDRAVSRSRALRRKLKDLDDSPDSASDHSVYHF